MFEFLSMMIACAHAVAIDTVDPLTNDEFVQANTLFVGWVRGDGFEPRSLPIFSRAVPVSYRCAG